MDKKHFIYLLLIFKLFFFIFLCVSFRFFLFCFCKRENLTALDRFNLAMTSEQFYSNDSQLVDALLRDMATRKIIAVGVYAFDV